MKLNLKLDYYIFGPIAQAMQVYKLAMSVDRSRRSIVDSALDFESEGHWLDSQLECPLARHYSFSQHVSMMIDMHCLSSPTANSSGKVISYLYRWFADSSTGYKELRMNG